MGHSVRRGQVRVGWVLACVLSAGLLAACGGSPSPSPSANSGPPHSASGNRAATGGAAASRQVSVPIRVVTRPDGVQKLLVDVSVGGGRPVPVILDTGSGGLYLLAGAIGPHASRTSQSGRRVYQGWSLTANTVRASFGIGGVSAPNPIAVGSISAIRPAGHFALYGAQGIMGVGRVPQAAPGFLSPLAQLPAPSWQGFTIELHAPGGPRLLLGRPSRSDTSVLLPLTRADARYPNGSPAYDGIVTLCWRVAAQRRCGPTLPDTGDPRGSVSAVLLPQLPRAGSFVGLGLPVSISAPAPGSTILRSFTTAPTPPANHPGYGRRPLFSTGIGPYLSNGIGFDVVSGHAVVNPS